MILDEHEFTEDVLSQFYELKQKKKEIDDEISRLRGEILTYINHTSGEMADAKIEMGPYVVHRKIRKQEKFDREKTVAKLKALGLEECIKTIEEPDEEKLKSALSLKFISLDDLEGCVHYKMTPYLSIEKYS